MHTINILRSITEGWKTWLLITIFIIIVIWLITLIFPQIKNHDSFKSYNNNSIIENITEGHSSINNKSIEKNSTLDHHSTIINENTEEPLVKESFSTESSLTEDSSIEKVDPKSDETSLIIEECSPKTRENVSENVSEKDSEMDKSDIIDENTKPVLKRESIEEPREHREPIEPIEEEFSNIIDTHSIEFDDFNMSSLETYPDPPDDPNRTLRHNIVYEYDDNLTPPPPWVQGTKTHPERKCQIFLEELFGRPFVTTRPYFLKNPETGRNLELDCYNHDLRLAVEYNGSQHYVWPNRYNSNDLEKFKKQRYRDNIKRQMCIDHNIYLIVVPYYIAINRIENYIFVNLPPDLKKLCPPSMFKLYE